MITIPKVSEIADQIIVSIESKIGQTIPAMPKAFFRVFAVAVAGVVSLLYRFGAWVYEQIFPQTADIEALIRIGEQYNITQNAAVACQLTATATGANDTVIPANTLWINADGIVYLQSADATIAGGTATITVVAQSTGDNTNLEIGDTIDLATPQAGVDTDATVASILTVGEDAETVESFRQRIIVRQQQVPQGGAVPDYINWALEVPGIVKAFAFRTDDLEVTVYPLVALSGTRLPDAGELTTVETYLNDQSRKPLCANVFAAAMTERTITVTVTAVQPATVAMKDAIELSWENYLLRAYPMQYADEQNPTHIVSLAGLYAEAIGAGAQSITMTMTINGVPGAIAAYTLLDNEIIKLASVVWP